MRKTAPYVPKMGFSTFLSIQINTPKKNSLSLVPFSKSSFLNTHRNSSNVSICSTKRTLNLAILSLIIYGSSSILGRAVELEQFERYTDSKEGFTLLTPSSYVRADKAGATVLFEEGTNNIGVVVTPVRLTTLSQFGTPHFVANKLIQAERRKESTKDAEVIEVGERSWKGGLLIYEFEYKIDSTRGGTKRIFSAAFVASKKLFLLNISHSDKPESPLDTRTRTMLENVLHSFDSATDSS